MIDDNTMDKLIPIKDEEEEMEKLRENLEGEGFLVTNFNKGGIFYTFARMMVHIYIELLELSRTIINSCFMKHADGDWLDIKAADYGKARKEARKAKGYITIYRSSSNEALQITKGHMFRTLPDSNGEEKHFYVVEDTVIKAGEEVGKVLVEAGKEGTTYNLPPNTITISMIHLSGVERVTNEEGWLYEEGTDMETDESLRERCLNSYSELANLTIRDKLKNVVRAVQGVVAVEIDDQHPRGQGTVDIYVAGTAGEATEGLLEEVRKAIEPLRGQYEDYEVKSAETYKQDFDITVYLAEDASTEGVKDLVQEILEKLLSFDRAELDRFYLDRIIQEFGTIPGYKTAQIQTPPGNVILEDYQVIVLGDTNIKVKNVGRN